MKNIRKVFSRSIWNIGFIDISKAADLFKEWDIQQLKHNEKRWFADPFILDVTNHEIMILVEEMEFNREKGRIAWLRVDKKTYDLLEYKILLELESHLSFPAIIRRNDEVYVYPENSESGKLSLYRYDFSKNVLVEEKEMISLPLTDAIYYRVKNGEYILSTKMPDPNGGCLCIYKKGSDGNYMQTQSVLFSDNTARNAGDIFCLGGKLIRPAQNCNEYYGKGIAFQEVSNINSIFSFKELGRVSVPKGYNGMHTFNTYKGVTVVDLRRPVHPFIHSTFLKMRRLFK